MSASRLRVLLIVGSYPPMKCGVGDYTAQLASALARRGDVDVGVLTHGSAAQDSNGNVEVLPVAGDWEPGARRAIVAAVRGWRPGIAHIQYPSQGYGRRWLPWLLPRMLARRNIRIVQTWHEYLTIPIPRYIPPGLVRGGLVAVRPRYRETMRWPVTHFLRGKEFRYIPNASTVPAVELTSNERQAVRQRYAAGHRRLIVYFGFVYPPKGVDLLFDIADAQRDALVIAADLNPNDAYHRSIRDRLTSEAWNENATAVGFLPPDELARLIAAADAVVLPFREGGGSWNTSIHAVVAAGTFLLTTSAEQHGYDEPDNTYYAEPGNVEEMREALRTIAGARKPARLSDPWADIAEKHVELYRSVVGV